jgi:hypothetical protein
MDPWFTPSQCDAIIEHVVGLAEIGYCDEIRTARCVTWVNEFEMGIQ